MVVLFAKTDEVAKRLELVLLVVDALVAAKKVEVALVRVLFNEVRLVVEAVTAANSVAVAFVAIRLVVKKLVVVPLVPKKLVK